MEIREFVRTDYPRLVAAIGLMTGSRAAAEDAVQEALARAWARSGQGERIERLGAWVTTVSLNLARSGLRRLAAERRARQRLMDRPGDGPPPDVADRLDLRRALAGLPRRQREAIVLRYYLGLDVAEVAVVMRTPVGTAKSLLSRARTTLARELGDIDLEDVKEP